MMPLLSCSCAFSIACIIVFLNEINGDGDIPTRLSKLKKCDDMSIRLDTEPALDRQTDRQTEGRTDLLKQYRALHVLHVDAVSK